MSSSRLALILVPLLVGLAGCMRTTISTGRPPGETHQMKATFFLFGVVGEENFDLSQICPGGVATIEQTSEVDDVLLSCITCSLYTPVTVRVTCASGAAYLLTPNPDANVTAAVVADVVLAEGT